MPGTSTSQPLPPRADDLQFATRDGVPYLVASLDDGRILALPLELYPLLLHATNKERLNWVPIGRGRGFHWPDLDLDLSVAGMLAGAPDTTKKANRLRRGSASSKWVLQRRSPAGLRKRRR
jgi:hypothetical protein